MNPVINHSPRGSLAFHDDWRTDLVKLRRYVKRGSPLDNLITDLVSNPQAIPHQVDREQLINACLFNGEAELLRLMIAQEPSQTFRICALECDGELSLALDTLLKAMPNDWQVGKLTLNGGLLDACACQRLLEVLGRMPKLRLLSLEGTKVVADSSPDLPSSAPLTLKKLTLGCRGNAYPLLQTILSDSKLNTLELCGNRDLTDEQHHSIALLLDAQTELLELRLHLLQGTKGFSYYMAHMERQETVRCLDLSHMWLNKIDFSAICKALRDKGPIKLVLVDCWANERRSSPDFWPAETRPGPDELKELCSLKGLVHLDLSGIFLPDECDATPVLSTLATHPTLQHLNLSDATLPSASLEAFAAGLAGNKAL